MILLTNSENRMIKGIKNMKINLGCVVSRVDAKKHNSSDVKSSSSDSFCLHFQYHCNPLSCYHFFYECSGFNVVNFCYFEAMRVTITVQIALCEICLNFVEKISFHPLLPEASRLSKKILSLPSSLTNFSLFVINRSNASFHVASTATKFPRYVRILDTPN